MSVDEKKIRGIKVMDFALGCLLLIIISSGIVSGMTRAQVKKTLTVIKNQCMPKAGVTNDKVGQIEQGVFIEDHKVMCYIVCIYKGIQVVKNEKLDKDRVFKQVDALYPADMKIPVKKAIEKCIVVQDIYSDPCEAIFYAAKCLYETDPTNFIFP